MLHFKKKIDEEGITPEIVLEVMREHEKDQKRMLQQYKRYRADIDGPPILQRRKEIKEDFETGGNIRKLDDRINNRLNNAFDVEIVDTKIGYMFGHAISYTVDEEIDSTQALVDDFNLMNNVEDLDAELGKKAAICGYGARVIYVKDGEERIKNLDPWQVVFIGDDYTQPDYSFYFWEEGDDLFCDFYDDIYVTTYTSNGGGGKFTEIDMVQHMADFNPLYGVPNNEEFKGDAERVFNLIDAFDRTLSDASNEIEAYRLAYLILKGMGADPETLEQAKQAGVFELFEKDDDVKFLTKDINDQLIENHLDRLEERIIRGAKSANFNDEAFSGNASGVAIRYKLQALENNCKTFERKFVSMLRYQNKVLFSMWAKKNKVSAEDYLKVHFQFKRNLPVNLLEEAQIQQALMGVMSDELRVGLFSEVDDIQYELDKQAEDRERMGNELEPLGVDDDDQ